jgi:fatty acid desaturase
MPTSRRQNVEWPTLGLIIACYAVWGGVVFGGWLPVWLAVLILIPMITLHSSLQHEVIHGHPLRSKTLSAALVYPPLGLLIPFERFRDQHLHHHLDSRLTDPYDDPESSYLDPFVWAKLPSPLKFLLNINNSLLGRIVLGPALGQYAFMAADFRAILAGNRAVAWVWLRHFTLVSVIIWLIVSFSALPFWAYFLGAYAGLSLLKIRTFLEHQAHLRASGRTVIIEDRGPLAWLFLNNNLHAVHHAHPKLAWYRLPATYLEHREHFLRRNHGYFYASYLAVFRAYALQRKEPVPHPLMPE